MAMFYFIFEENKFWSSKRTLFSNMTGMKILKIIIVICIAIIVGAVVCTTKCLFVYMRVYISRIEDTKKRRASKSREAKVCAISIATVEAYFTGRKSLALMSRDLLSSSSIYYIQIPEMLYIRL